MARLAVPAIGLSQLTGVTIAAGLWSRSGVDYGLLLSLPVLVLAAVSLVLAWLGAFIKKTRMREQQFLASRIERFEPRDHLFLSVKLAFWPSLMRLCWGFAALLTTGLLDGFPRILRWDLFLGFLAIYMGGPRGRPCCLGRHGEGIPAFNGIGATGAIGFVFLWAALLQGIVPETFQLWGAGLTLAGGVALAFTERSVRVKAGTFLRRLPLTGRRGRMR